MWVQLLYTTLICGFVLFGPGFLFFQGLGLSRIFALCVAPLFTVFMCSTLPILYYELGISCNVFSILAPTLLIALLSLALGAIVRRFRKTTDDDLLSFDNIRGITVFQHEIPFDVLVPLSFVVVSTAVCLFVFIPALPAANAIAPRYDNQTHLNLCRAFLDSGKWSSLHPSKYLDLPVNSRAASGLNGFYPSAWNDVVVLISLSTHADLMVTVNAVVVLTSCALFPMAMYAFMRVVLPNERRAVLLGAIAVTGFSNWPWVYVYTGPLYPNHLGAALQFCALALFIGLLQRKTPGRDAPVLVVTSIVSFGALALAHPNTLFSSYVCVVFYGAHLLCGCTTGKKRVFALVGYAVPAIGLWCACLYIPALQPIIAYSEGTPTDIVTAIKDLFELRFAFDGYQLGMFVSCAVGCVFAAMHKNLRWLLGPVAFFAIGYVSVRIGWWPGSHWLASLWYSDWRRIAANMVNYLMPLAALGLSTILPASGHGKMRILRTALAIAVVFVTFTPPFTIPGTSIHITTPLAQMADRLYQRYHELIYSPEEIAFVNEAMQYMPQGSLVINTPADGSLWSYGANGMKVYYRSLRLDDQTQNAVTIRQHLNEYATNPNVQKAVQEIDARYVLQLDKDVPYEQGVWLWQFNKDKVGDWNGVSLVSDDTPGFSVLLSEGSEMRLYEIERTDLDE